MRYPGRLVSASPYLPRAPSSLTAAQDTTPFTRKFASRYVLLSELSISLPPSYLCLPSLLVLRPCPPVLRRCLGWDGIGLTLFLTAEPIKLITPGHPSRRRMPSSSSAQALAAAQDGRWVPAVLCRVLSSLIRICPIASMASTPKAALRNL